MVGPSGGHGAPVARMVAGRGKEGVGDVVALGKEENSPSFANLPALNISLGVLKLSLGLLKLNLDINKLNLDIINLNLDAPGINLDAPKLVAPNLVLDAPNLVALNLDVLNLDALNLDAPNQLDLPGDNSLSLAPLKMAPTEAVQNRG